MIEIAREELSLGEPRRGDAFWRARARALMEGLEGESRRKGVLRAFLEREAIADGRAPVALEAEATLALDLSLDLDRGTGTPARLVCRSIIDRVDREAEGPGYVVYDYKPGKRRPEMRDVLDGRSFQLPLYLLAARDLTPAGNRHGAPRPLGAAYYAVSDPRHLGPLWFGERSAFPEARNRGGLVDNLDAALERVPLAAGAVVSGMARGLFHPGDLPPERKGCGHCDARRVCRADHARARRMTEGEGPGVFRPLPLLVEAARA
jgi:hypothetical protein